MVSRGFRGFHMLSGDFSRVSGGFKGLRCVEGVSGGFWGAPGVFRGLHGFLGVSGSFRCASERIRGFQSSFSRLQQVSMEFRRAPRDFGVS